MVDGGRVKRCGYVALVGRPNVGKSTLLNRIMGRKVCITSRKAQTTRNRLLAVKTEGADQIIFLDTPGIGQQMKGALNQSLKRTALRALRDVDVVVLCVAGSRWGDDERWIVSQAERLALPVLVVMNKVDLLAHVDLLLPHIEKLSSDYQPKAWLPVSAQKGQGVAALLKAIVSHLPACDDFLFAEDHTDREPSFWACELIREQCLRRFGQEVPHQLVVQLEYQAMQNDCWHLHAVIWVAKPGQKKILLGSHGAHMKAMGTLVREALETLTGHKVFLKTWVKVKANWVDRPEDLKNLGFDVS